MSGRRTIGSSIGRSMKVMGEREPVASRMDSAISSTVSSSGQPTLTGPARSLAATASTPLTVSST